MAVDNSENDIQGLTACRKVKFYSTPYFVVPRNLASDAVSI